MLLIHRFSATQARLLPPPYEGREMRPLALHRQPDYRHVEVHCRRARRMGAPEAHGQRHAVPTPATRTPTSVASLFSRSSSPGFAGLTTGCRRSCRAGGCANANPMPCCTTARSSPWRSLANTSAWSRMSRSSPPSVAIGPTSFQGWPASTARCWCAKRVWARDRWHLANRLLRKVVMHPLAVFTNLALERPSAPSG